MSELDITSVANPRLKAVQALRRRRTRDQQGRTVVEGVEEIDLALRAGVRPVELYLCPDIADGRPVADAPRRDAVLMATRQAGVPILTLSRAAFEKISYREGPDGFLAVVDTPGRPLGELFAEAVPPQAFVLVAEAVEKPGNLGAMVRTADAAGVDAVIAADPVGDWGNPNVIRASKGTVFAVPVATAGTDELLDWLAEHPGLDLVVATPDAELDYTDIDLRGPVAVVVGAEKEGVSDTLLQAARHRVRIPMAGQADSLNVATSAALMLYEVVRQRRAS